MKDNLKRTLVLSLCLVLTGCWNRAELPSKAFVMGASIRVDDENRIELMVQVYRPSQKTANGAGSKGRPYVNVLTKGASTFDAARDITQQLGRKAQWSHMRIIIIDEKTAREQDLLSLLDFFYRDHEPRLTTRILIAEGDAKRFLKFTPMIEQTASQQLNRMQENAHLRSGKVPLSDLLELALALKSESGDAALPLASVDEGGNVRMTGMAIVRKGKMVGELRSYQTERAMMLMDKYKQGVLLLPCPGSAGESPLRNESIEVDQVRTKVRATPADDGLVIGVHVDMRGKMNELVCTSFKTREDERKFVQRVERETEEQLEETISLLQKRRVDLLGIGNLLYRRHAKLWKTWKADNWRERFASARVNVKVDFVLENTLTMTGIPISESEGGT